MIKKANWNGFLKICIKEYPKEVAALIYTENPYTDNEIWHICPVKNISKKPETHFKLDSKETREIFKKSRDLHRNLIGMIHTHPYPKREFSEEFLQKVLLPSKHDLRNAKCRDLIVTGIIACDKKAIYDIRFHNPFNSEKVDITLSEI